jgi:hypothetical protein
MCGWRPRPETGGRGACGRLASPARGPDPARGRPLVGRPCDSGSKTEKERGSNARGARLGDRQGRSAGLPRRFASGRPWVFWVSRMGATRHRKGPLDIDGTCSIPSEPTAAEGVRGLAARPGFRALSQHVDRERETIPRGGEVTGRGAWRGWRLRVWLGRGGSQLASASHQGYRANWASCP